MLNKLLFRSHLESDETLVLVVHKFWLVGVKALFWPTVFLGAGLFLLAASPTRAMITIVTCWSIVMSVWWLRNFFDYYLDAWIITDHGVIDIAWHGWFHRQSTRVLYSDVQGVSYEINGIIGTLLRVGSISMEKVSTESAVSLDYVQNPRRVETAILKNMETYLHAKNLKDGKQIQDLLASIVAERMQLNDFASTSTEE